jgi:hypothetical protein
MRLTLSANKELAVSNATFVIFKARVTGTASVGGACKAVTSAAACVVSAVSAGGKACFLRAL